MSDAYAPRIGFGIPATNDMAWFRVERDNDTGAVPDWTGSEPNIAITIIPGSFPPVVEKELISFGSATVTWRVGLDSRDDFRRLRSKLGTVGTLSILAGIQSHIGEHHPFHGQGYEYLPNTTLMALERVTVTIDGWVEADATFLRVIDPETGQAVP